MLSGITKHRETKTLASFRKGSDCMMLIMLHPKVPVRSNTSKGIEVRKIIQVMKVKVMTMVKTMEKVKSESRKLEQAGSLIGKQRDRVSSLIRIQIEDVKRKVRSCSPSNLSFIGPGD